MPCFAFVIADRPAAFQRAATFLASGVCLLSGRTVGGSEWAMTVSSVVAVSFEPALLLACIRRDSKLLHELPVGRTLSVSVLRDSDTAVARRFGTASATLGDDSRPGEIDALARFGCAVTQHIATGDHVMVLLEVSCAETAVGMPLLYWRRGLYGLSPQYSFLESADAFAKFVSAWQAGTLAATAWTHAAHVAVAASYAHELGADAVYPAMRKGILHFNHCIGVLNTDTSGYHDTLTRFWSEKVSAFVARHDFPSSYDAACAAVQEFGSDRDLYRMYYDGDILADPATRHSWVAPRA